MTIQLIADSACDLPITFLKENNVQLFPLKVHLNDEEYEDLVTIQPSIVYEAMRNGQTAVTSQASPEGMKNFFTKIAQEDKEAIYIAFSSELSGTYQTAVMMLEQVKETYPNCKIRIVDTKAASLGYGLIVKNAVDDLEAGNSYDDILTNIEFNCAHMEHLFTVDNLEYLYRGGRVSRTSAFIGGLLNIKPLLNVDNGKLIPIEKIRGRKKVLKRIVDLMDERGINLENQTVGISHGDDEETALEMKKAISERFGTSKFVINPIGSAVGAHAGPGTIAIFFLNKVKQQ